MVPEIDLHTFIAAHADGALVLDVRDAFEYVTGHVPPGNRSYTAAGWLRTAGISAA